MSARKFPNVTEQQLHDAIDEWSTGARGLVDICKELGCSPPWMYQQIAENPALAEAHMRARQVRAEIDVDEMKSIADNEPDVNRARIKIDLRKWVASKYNAQLYGDRLDVNVNTTIDVRSALNEAKSRALPQRDLLSHASHDVLTIPARCVNETSDPTSENGSDENASIDIFS